MGLKNYLRTKLFSHYAWIVAVFILTGTIFGVCKRYDDEEKLFALLVPIWGVGLSVVYFVQKQKVEELKLFEELFTNFNKRYSDMHHRLQRLPTSDSLEDRMARKEVLDNYFNLCAEEYLFYERGLILPWVWKSWCVGILYYCKPDSHFERYLKNDVKQSTHYGLTIEVIQKGASE